MNEKNTVRKHIIFYGRVQGVGFRYTAKYAAESYGVAGWVRNLYDGSVEMEAEGREADIDAMLTLLGQGRYIDIEDISVRDIPPEGERSFRIR